jgi:hypothetical protein
MQCFRTCSDILPMRISLSRFKSVVQILAILCTVGPTSQYYVGQSSVMQRGSIQDRVLVECERKDIT